MSDRVLYEINERPGGGWEVVRPLQARIQEFRQDRVAEIAAGNAPAALAPGPVTVVHFITNGSLDGRVPVDLRQWERYHSLLQPLYSSGWNHRYNADGFLTESSKRENRVDAYAQLFRNGVIEAASTGLASEYNGQRLVASQLFEDEIIDATARYVAVAEQLAAVSPHTAMITLIGGKGYSMAVDTSRRWSSGGRPFDRDLLQAPPVITVDASTVVAALRPSFDYFWQAAGWSGSQYYQEDGSRRQ